MVEQVNLLTMVEIKLNFSFYALATRLSCRVVHGVASEVVVRWQLYFYTMAAAASELANGFDIGAFSFALLYFKV